MQIFYISKDLGFPYRTSFWELGMSLEIIRPVLVDVTVPAILLGCSAIRTYGSKFCWMVWILGLAVYTIYTFIKGEWFLFGYYLRYGLLLGFVIVFVISLRSIMDVPLCMTMSLDEIAGISFLLLFLTFTLIVLGDKRHVKMSIDATFPLREGHYYIAQGGGNAIINHHAPAEYSKYAIDILKINTYGFRAKGFYPKDLQKYFIFEELVYSTVEGTVIKVIEDHPDMTPPCLDKEHPAGNHIITRHTGSGALIFLAHLRQRSILATEGDVVKEGQAIARVGNSGLSTEPHLHIHCEEDEVGELNVYGKGIPLLFDGRFLKRNDVVKC